MAWVGAECRDSLAFYFPDGKVKLWSGDFKQSPATLIRVAFKFSNLALEKLKPKEQMLFRF